MTEPIQEAYCKQTGSCLCGGVRYVIEADAPREKVLRPLVACHCAPCRKTSGSFVVATKVETKHLSFQNQATLAWYRSSEQAERGFCSRCGASLFYRLLEQEDEEAWSVMLGALEGAQADDLPFAGHIFAKAAHPMLARLSTTPQSEAWAEQPLVEELHKQGWHDTHRLQNFSTPPSS